MQSQDASDLLRPLFWSAAPQVLIGSSCHRKGAMEISGVSCKGTNLSCRAHTHDTITLGSGFSA